MNARLQPVRRLFFILSLFFFRFNQLWAQTADFQADVVSGCSPLTVQFTDKSTGGPSSWVWDFGNTNTSFSQNPSAVYSQPGTYTVSLKVNGGSLKTKTGYIVVYDKPSVDFTSNITTGCYPLNVQFTSTSSPGSGSIASTIWVFGDGNTSTNVNPLYTYNSPATYNVTLTVANDKGCSNSIVKTSYITAKGPFTDFSASQVSFCQAPATVAFTNSSSGQAPVSYQWNFGDGTAASSQVSPSHQFTNTGIFSVALTTTDGSGCSITKTRNNLISVGSQHGVDFTFSPTQVCIGQTVNFTDVTTVIEASRNWDFGNGLNSTDVSPTTSYTKEGFYTIKLTTNLASGCSASVSKDIEVVFDAVPDFNITAGCKQKVSFNNTSKYASSYSWDFGDGQTSSENSPVHSFLSSGQFTITLTAYNALNCPFILKKDITVFGDPLAAIDPNSTNSCDGLSLSGCAPFNIQFSNKTQSDLPITITQWFFGDNTQSSSNSPQHTYVNSGKYNVMLVVSNSKNCRDTARAIVNVSSTKPKADFTASSTSVCVFQSIDFKSTSQNADFWCWDFGDGMKDNGEDKVHKYTTPGVYTVTLTAKNGGCEDAITKNQIIKVNDPSFGFDIAPIDCSSPFDVKVTNTSANYDSFLWDFGDGTTNSTVATGLVHHYQNSGVYAIKLHLENNTSNCKIDSSKSVSVQQVKADFSLDNSPICKNNPITFHDQSQFALTWAWDFGDGNTSQSQSPIENYPTPGTYTISLTVSDVNSCSDKKTVPLKVADMQGSFSFDAVSDCNALQVTFKDASTGSPPIQSWLWDFGDGQTSSNENPVHTYNTLKSYTVKVTLQNSDAACSLSSVDAVVFSNPVIDYEASKTSICLNEPITFFNKTTNAQSFSWDFGDGQTASDPVPSKAYTMPGSYTVTLMATDQYGCEKSLTKTDYLQVLKPTALFEAVQTSAECPPLITSFKNFSSPDVVSWSWTFGDGQSSVIANPTNTYVKPGTYDVELEVTNSTGCTDQVTKAGLVSVGGPNGTYTIDTQPICVGQEIVFDAVTTNTVQYIWDFGDGTVETGTQVSISHKYTNAADYTSSLTLVDSKGCKVTVNNSAKVSVKDNPKIDFDIHSDYAFEGEAVTFIATTDQYTLLWNFDGIPDIGGANVEKSFDHYGKHHVTLNAQNNTTGCNSSIGKDLFIQGDITMIPNVFTPNDTDSSNSTFEILDLPKGFWSITIYNRWGNKVYYSNLYNNDWTGEGLSDGVYYYHITNQYRPDKKYKGYVQIMR